MEVKMKWSSGVLSAVLALAAIGVFAIHALTAGEYPPAWFDEIEIIEMGRFSIFDIQPDWSVNLYIGSDGTLQVPLPMLHYLAGMMQELLYRTTGGFLCGRFVMLLSLSFCSMALFGWLRTKEFLPHVAFLTSLLFLCDPNASICAHWYRPDLWCMTIIFTALTIMAKTAGTKRQLAGFASAGLLASTSVFFWITSVLFLPMVFIEAWLLTGKRSAKLSALFFGSATAAALLLIPLYRYIPDITNQFLTRSEVGSIGRTTGAQKYLDNAFDFVKIAIRSPFSWCFAAIGLSFRRFKAHAILFICLSLFMIATRVYHLRMVYLMPYIFLFTATALDRLLGARKTFIVRGGWLIATAALAGCFGISVVALNYAAWPEQNTLPEFTKRLQAAIPAQSPRVYLMDMEHELYYAGRKLGWKMYSTTPRTIILNGQHEEFLKKLDAVVVTEMGPKLTGADKNALQRSGFRQTATFTMPPAATGFLKSKIATAVYAHGYPACEIWTRQ